MMIDQDRPLVNLTAHDRCDRCGAQALVLAENDASSHSDLLFCAHHAREYKDKLRKDGYRLTADEVKSEQSGFDHAAALV